MIDKALGCNAATSMANFKLTLIKRLVIPIRISEIMLRMSPKYYLIPALLCACVAPVSAQLQNPAPSVLPSDVRVKATEIVRLPAVGALAKGINMLREAPDGSGRLFVLDLRGKIYLIEDGDYSVYIDVKQQIGNKFIDAPGMGTGLSAFAFHPDFATNGKFYTGHAEAPGSGTPDFTPPNVATFTLQGVWTEWTADDPSANTFTGTRRELLRVNVPGNLHGVQELAFNPTAKSGDPDYGILYMTLGDGASMRDGRPGNLGHKGSLLGTIMRIDPLGNNSPNGKYGIPADNPFANDPEARKEIWAMGFRNPHRMNWDPATGDMYLGDIGEMNIEEVNLILPGHNYGWPDREGTWLFDRNSGANSFYLYELPDNDESFGFTYPVAQYDHQEDKNGVNAIALGGVYRGNELPELKGKFVLGDIASGRMKYFEADAVQLGNQVPVYEFKAKLDNNQSFTALDLVKRNKNSNRADLRFSQDLKGNIYLLTKIDGAVYRFESLTPPPPENPFEGEPGLKDTWMGELDDTSYPWVEHQQLGWLFMMQGDADGMWFLYQHRDSWMWSSQDAYPWIYIAR